ncbi:MAG: hypothetical protein ABGX16_19485, partial [Pirellulales bacterium]
PQPESRALADCRRTLRLQAVVFSLKKDFKRDEQEVQDIEQKLTKITKMHTKTSSQKPCREYIAEFTGHGVLPFQFVFVPFVPVG